MDKYVTLAKTLGMVNAKVISPDDIVFDPRSILKCRWGCDDPDTEKCRDRGVPYEMRVQIVQSYQKILLIHSHDVRKLYSAALKIERQAFLDGHLFAFTLSPCFYCRSCAIVKGKECSFPEKIRPCDQLFGINTYDTVKKQGLPCQVLKGPDQQQNRYAFILIE